MERSPVAIIDSLCMIRSCAHQWIVNMVLMHFREDIRQGLSLRQPLQENPQCMICWGYLRTAETSVDLSSWTPCCTSPFQSKLWKNGIIPNTCILKCRAHISMYYFTHKFQDSLQDRISKYYFSPLYHLF